MLTLVELRKIALACLQIYQAIYGYIYLICGYLKAILWRESTQIGLPICRMNRNADSGIDFDNYKIVYDDYRIGSGRFVNSI
jgi:hypothetical protein